MYLWTNGEWKYFKNPTEKQLRIRDIVIGDSAKIGNYAKIGHNVTLGNYADIGESAKIGHNVTLGLYADIGKSAKIGSYAKIGHNVTLGLYADIGESAKIGSYAKIGHNFTLGNYAEIGSYAKIGNYADIGESAKIGNYAKIGHNVKLGIYAEIGNHVVIGSYAKIGNNEKIKKTANDFSIEKIYQQLGVLPDNKGTYTLYKSVKPNLCSFYTDTHKYIEGKGWSNNSLKQNQSIECGEGCHFSTYMNAVSFAEKRDHIIISAKIKLKDILSVHQKVRVRAYSDVRIVRLNL